MRVLTVFEYGKASRVWDAQTGLPLTQPLRNQEEQFDGGFSPNGLWVVNPSKDGTARVWDVSSGQALALLFSHCDGVIDANFSADGRHIVTASVFASVSWLDNSAQVWDAQTGQAIGPPL